MCDVARNSEKGGWTEYWWNMPDEKEPSRKVTFILPVSGTPYFVAAGIYNDDLSLPELNQLIDTVMDKEKSPDTEEITYSPPDVNKISSDTYEIKLAGSDGSEYVTTVKKTEQQIYPESVRYTPPPSGNSAIPAYTGHINPEGSRVELQVDDSPRIWIIDRTDPQKPPILKVKEKDSQEETDLYEFPMPEDVKYPEIDADSDSCAKGKKFCKSYKQLKITEVLSFFAADLFTSGIITTAITGGAGLPLLVPAGVVGNFAMVSNMIDYSCILLFGNDNDIVAELPGTVAGTIAGSATKSAVKSIKVSKEFTEKIINSEFGKKIESVFKKSNKILGKKPQSSREIAGEVAGDAGGITGEFFGKSKPVQDVVQNIGSSFGKPKSGLLPDLRKKLGLNFCDKKCDACFTGKPKTGKAPLKVSLNAGCSEPNDAVIEYLWSSSDGQSASGEKASMTFSEQGNYTVTLTTQDDSGCKDTQEETIKVSENPCLACYQLCERYGGDTDMALSICLCRADLAIEQKQSFIQECKDMGGKITMQKWGRGLKPYFGQCECR